MPELNDTAASRLCAACGMCCNGVLFHGMQVQPQDSLRSLASKGLKPKRRDGELYFPQPCPAHQDSCCQIYNDRPQRCRAFVCKQLAAVIDGKKTEDAALEKIREARVLTAENRTSICHHFLNVRVSNSGANCSATVFNHDLGNCA